MFSDVHDWRGGWESYPFRFAFDSVAILAQALLVLAKMGLYSVSAEPLRLLQEAILSVKSSYEGHTV